MNGTFEKFPEKDARKEKECFVSVLFAKHFS